MPILALKLTLTPVLIGLASLAGRKWGPAISGWLIGLPLTSGPIIFLLALAHGASFASSAATGTLAGVLSEAVFTLAYGWLAWSGAKLWVTILGGIVAFLGAVMALQGVALVVAPVFALAVAALLLTLRLMPRRFPAQRTPVEIAESDDAALPWWDLPARMVIATVFVVALTSVAASLGPHLTGLLSPFPLYAIILAAFAQHQQGPWAAVRVLRGLLLGLFSFAAFFLALAVLLERMGVAGAFVCAALAALATQGASLWLMRRAARTSAVGVAGA